MSEYSLIFDFNRADWFYDDLNINFGKDTFLDSPQYLIIASQCSPNIDECFDGTTHQLINNSIDILATENIQLEWSEGVDGSRAIVVGEDFEYPIVSDTVRIQGLFFVSSNNTLIGYCIYDNPTKITNVLKIEEGTILWSVTNGGYHG